MNRLYRTYGKRLFDLTFGILGLAVLSPILLLIALMIKVTSKGPVLYVQERIGHQGVPFQFIKFRTMVVGAEHQGTGVLVLKQDPRVTRIGRLLRAFSLDELPQLINVIRGDMSLIGPRPGLPFQVSLYTAEQRGRLAVKPGITGWAQVNGRNSIPWNVRIAYDLEYARRLSFGLDVRILARTLRAVFFSDNLFAEADYFKTRSADRGTVSSPSAQEPPSAPTTLSSVNESEEQGHGEHARTS